MAAANAISWFRPPRPDPRTVTVVSPPKITHPGRPTGRPWRAMSRAVPASVSANSRASPSTAEVTCSASNPRARAVRAVAVAACALSAMITLRTAASRASPGFGLSASAPAAPRWRCSRIAAGAASRRPWSSSARSASAYVVGSGTVGPEAITSNGLSTTSLRISATTRAGCAAAASRPPWITDKCLRTALMALMVAPLRSS